MALWRITIKNSGTCNNVHYEKGMSVELSWRDSPMPSNEGRQAVKNAFIQKYGIDLAKAGLLSGVFVDEEKIG